MGIAIVFFGWIICCYLSLLERAGSIPKEGGRITRQMELQMAIALAYEAEGLHQLVEKFSIRLGTIMGWLLYLTLCLNLQ